MKSKSKDKSKYNSSKWVYHKETGLYFPLADLQKEADYKNMDVKTKKLWMAKLKKTATIFDSKKEMEYYIYLLEKEYNGEISHLILQPKYILQPSDKELKLVMIKYVADFEYIKDGEHIVVDVKGMATATAKLKRKLFMYTHREYKLEWVVWATNKIGWMDYFDNEKRKKTNRENKKKRT